MLNQLPLSEIRTRVNAFSMEWVNVSRENAEARSFWDAFFTVFGLSRRRMASFEEPVKKQDGKGGFIDLLWKGVLLVEHKSPGKDLDSAYGQAKDYFAGLKDRDLPRYVVVSDFDRFRLYDLDKDVKHDFTLKSLSHYVHLFSFMAGRPMRAFRRWLGADEFIKGYERWCLWLGDAAPAELRALPRALKRVQAHQVPDRAVDAAYDRTKFAKEGERVSFLFGLYPRMVAPLEAAAAAKKAATRKRVTKVAKVAA